METASLYQGLTFLAWTSVGFLIIVGLFIVKVLFDLSRLLKSINQTAVLVKEGSEPIIKDLTESVKILASMAKRTENNVTSIKNFLGNSSKYLIAGLIKTSKFSGVIFKWITSIIKMFTKISK